MSATTRSGLISPRRPAAGASSDGSTPRDPSSRPAFRFGRVLVNEASFEWLLKRNCSLAPRQLVAVFGSLCVASMVVAGYCWAAGAKLVMPFAGLELAGLGAALFMYARHAADFEYIQLRLGRLTVEHANGPRVQRVEFESAWVRVEPKDGDRSLIELSGQGRHIAVGRFVRPELRRQLAEELRMALRGWPRAGAPEAL